MALNPIIEAFLAAREQASRDYAGSENRRLQSEAQKAQEKHQEEVLKQQLAISQNELAQRKAMDDAHNLLTKQNLDLTERTRKLQALNTLTQGVAAGTMKPPTKEVLNPDFLRVGQPTTTEEPDIESWVSALTPVLGGNPQEVENMIKLMPQYGQKHKQAMEAEAAKRKLMSEAKAEEQAALFEQQRGLQGERLDSTEEQNRLNRENQLKIAQGNWTNRLEAARLRASGKSKANENSLRGLAATEAMQFATGQANENSLSKFTSIKQREEFVQALKDMGITVPSVGQTKAYEGLNTLVSAYSKYKAYSDAIEKSANASTFGTVSASFDPDVLAKEKEANSVLEIVGRGELQAKGVITDKDAERLTGARPDPFPAGKWSIGQTKKTLQTNRERLADFQYHIMNKLNQNTLGFSADQKKILMDNAGIRLDELLPEVIERLNKGK